MNILNKLDETVNIMLDLETFGTSPTSVIVAIGATKFDKSHIYDEFYCKVDPKTCIEHGLKMDVDTIIWWLGQSDSARTELTNGKNVKTLHNSLYSFYEWATANLSNKKLTVWGNGSDFDNVILTHAYKACGIKSPWSYSGNRCFRTINNLFDFVPATPYKGISHNALHDATNQTNRLFEIVSYISNNESTPNLQSMFSVDDPVDKVMDELFSDVISPSIAKKVSMKTFGKKLVKPSNVSSTLISVFKDIID